MIRSSSLLILVVFLAIWASLVAQTVKNLPAMQEIQVQSLGQEVALEKGMVVPYSSILVWRIPWMEKPGGLQSMGSQRVRHNWATFTFTVYAAFFFLSISGSIFPAFPVYLWTTEYHCNTFPFNIKTPEFISLVCNYEPQGPNHWVPRFPSNTDIHSSGKETVAYPLPREMASLWSHNP